MKKYFWSGNTNISNGSNQQRWGIAEVDDDVDPYDLAEQIVADKTKDSGADSFCLVAFNLIT